jgi:hypothetical protein
MNSFAFIQFPNQNDCRTQVFISCFDQINPLTAELNPTCHLLTLLGFHHILYIDRIRVKRQNPSLQLLHTEALVEIRTKAMLNLTNHIFC